jgi:hypothetical protein
MKSSRQINKNSVVFLSLMFSILYVFGGAAFAGTTTKTFDFGVGGDNPTFRSHSRVFFIPRDVAAAVRINYRASGAAPVPVVIEIEDADSRIAATREVSAEKSNKQIIINIAAGENTVYGCEKGWQIRVKSKDGQIPPARIFGDITLSFIDPAATQILLEGQSFGLKKKSEVSRRIGSAETFRHSGVVNIKSSWTHNPLAQALPLKFELVRPDGSVAKSLVGYGTNSNAQPKMDFDYRIAAADTKQTGVWRLRISNGTEQEIFEIKPGVNFTRRCFE